MGAEWEKLKKKARDAAIKLTDVMAEPSVRKTARFASGVLEVMSYVNKKNPISVGSGAISLVDTALDAFEIPYPTKTEHFAKKYDLQVKVSGLPRILVDAGIVDNFENRIIFTDGTWAVRELVVDEQSKMYYAENTDNSVHYEDPLGNLSSSFYHTKDFNFNKLFDAIWDRYEHGLFVSATNTTRRKWEGHTMRLHDLTTDDCLYVGELDPKQFAQDVEQFRKENISRSFMLVGVPGTGKTSFVIEVGRNISNRIVRIDPTIAHTFTSSEFDFLIENLNPDILVFDDFDRAAMSNDSQHLLFLLENIKYRFPHTIIFATVNYFDKIDQALVRPGRFDKIIWFDLPTPKIRAQIAEKYLKINGIPATAKLLQDIVKKTEGLSPVYIKELCIRLKYTGPESVDEIIQEFKRVLEDTSGMYEMEAPSHKEEYELDEDFYRELQLRIERELSDPF